MPYSKDDVGNIPGKQSLTDDARQAIADEWNATEAAAVVERQAEADNRQKASDLKVLADALPDIIKNVPGLAGKLPPRAKEAFDRLNK